jgi:hypothetical protein
MMSWDSTKPLIFISYEIAEPGPVRLSLCDCVLARLSAIDPVRQVTAGARLSSPPKLPACRTYRRQASVVW